MEIYSNILESKIPERNLSLIYESSLNHHVFIHGEASIVKSHIIHINNSLMTDKRSEGIKLLVTLLEQCDVSLLKEYGNIWFRLCYKGIQDKCCLPITKHHFCYAMVYILKYASFVSDLKVSLKSEENIFLASLLNVDPLLMSSSFKVIYEYLLLFPKKCVPYKSKIEEAIYPLLKEKVESDVVNERLVWGCRLLAALPIMSSGTEVVKAEMRGKQLNNLIGLAHQCMDVIFGRATEKETYPQSREHNIPVAFLTVGENLNNIIMSGTVLCNTFVFIKEVITSHILDRLLFKPQDLVNVVMRILQAEVNSIRRTIGQEHQITVFLLPSLQQRALSLLQQMMKFQGEHLDLYTGVLQEQLVSVCRASLHKLHGNARRPKDSALQQQGELYGQRTRRAAYAVLKTLVEVSEGCHSPPDILSVLLVNDIMPANDKMVLQESKLLTVGNRINGNLSGMTVAKRKKNKGCTLFKDSQLSREEGVRFAGAEAPLVREALHLIACVFTKMHHNLSRKFVQTLQNSLLQVVQVPCHKGEYLLGAYKDSECRKLLYEALLAMALYPHPQCPPSYCSLTLAFQYAIADHNQEVVSVCERGLASLSFIMANPQSGAYCDALTLAQKEQQMNVEEINGSEDEIEDDDIQVMEEESEEEIIEETGDEILTAKEQQRFEEIHRMLNGDKSEERIVNVIANENRVDKEVNVTTIEDNEIRVGIDENYFSEQYNTLLNLAKETEREVITLDDTEDDNIDDDDDAITIIEKDDSSNVQPSVDNNTTDTTQVTQPLVGETTNTDETSSTNEAVDSNARNVYGLSLRSHHKKRKANDEQEEGKKKSLRISDSQVEPSIEEMLSTFVEAVPDSD